MTGEGRPDRLSGAMQFDLGIGKGTDNRMRNDAYTRIDSSSSVTCRTVNQRERSRRTGSKLILRWSLEETKLPYPRHLSLSSLLFDLCRVRTRIQTLPFTNNCKGSPHIKLVECRTRERSLQIEPSFSTIGQTASTAHSCLRSLRRHHVRFITCYFHAFVELFE